MPVNRVIHLHSNDNIGIAACDLKRGDEIEAGGNRVTLNADVKLAHKFAIEPIAAGEQVRKYGQPIGVCTVDTAPGDWIHSHNLEQGEFALDYAKSQEIPPPPTPITDATFLGYRRPDGKAGTRNYLAVIATVNCSATVCKAIARSFDAEALSEFPNVDGVVAFTHDSGCGMQFGGLKHDMLNRVLGGIARHPNIGGFLLIGLGCEQGAVGHLVQEQNLLEIKGFESDQNGLPILTMQDLGGTQKTVAAGKEAVRELLPRVNNVTRVPIPASELILATECGGSDGNSGITANPAVGVAADMLVAAGGTAILAETSEIYGAEHLLTRRSVTPEIADKLLERIEWWQWYVGLYGVELDNNPSVGNKAGGLTTIAEKSLGAVAKAGSTAIVDVYQYAEQVTAKGQVIMDTPGFDP
ncbi:MAG: altronate dehydratase family protein, partial [bacterium]|nr:altronate dehydratase family protein [bacterium]